MRLILRSLLSLISQLELQFLYPLIVFGLLGGGLRCDGLLIQLVDAQLELFFVILQLQNFVRLLAELLLQLLDLVVFRSLVISVQKPGHALHSLRLELRHELLGLHLGVLRLQLTKLLGHGFQLT